MANKGSIPWNKGLTKETDNRVDKYSKTKSEKQTGKQGKNRKYSFNPDDWFNVCVKCEKRQNYKSRDSFVNAARKAAKEGEYKCCVCSADYQCSAETQAKKDRTAYLNSLTPEQKKVELSNMFSEIMKTRYANVSDEWREERNGKISKTKLEMDEDRKRDIYEKIGNKLRESKIDGAGNFIFRPGYNKDTIPYIENVLNEKYNTKFIHAETERGEFKIYDKDEKRFYYADAYCPNLNLWIEFDEPQKFKNGKLPDEHYIREHRIKCLIDNVIVERIYFDRTKFKN